MVLEFPTLPDLPPAALATTLAALLAMSTGEVASLTGLGAAWASRLLSEVLTLQVLLEASALTDIRLGDMTPT